MSDKKKPNVRMIELLLIRDIPSRKETGSGVKIRLVTFAYDFAWTQDLGERGYFAGGDGKAFIVKLEKRSYYTKEGKKLPGKVEGLLLNDLAFLHPRWKEMIALMKNPPKPPLLPAPVKPQDDAIEEVPFQ